MRSRGAECSIRKWMADTINRIDISINSQVQQINRLAENVKSSQIVRAYLKKEIHTQEETEELNDWMEGLLNLISSCSDLILMNEDGTVYYSYSGCQAVNDKRRMEVYENAASNLVGDGTWTEKGSSLCQKNAEEVVTFISSINKVILAIELNPETFGLLMLNNYSTFQNQYTYLVDCAGNVLCSNKTNIYDWGDVVTKGMEKRVRRYEFNWDNKDYFACRQYNGLTGWETYSVVSTDDFFPQAKRLREAIMGLVLLAMLAAGVGIFILSYTFTRPIGRLKNAMKQVEAGDFEIQVESKAHDEIGMLIQSFNYMVSRLRQLIMEVYQQKLAQKNAELTALQAQINPHFLYNTLFISFLLFWAMNVYIAGSGSSALQKLEKFAAPVLIVLSFIVIIWGIRSADWSVSKLLSDPSLQGDPSKNFWTLFFPALSSMIAFDGGIALSMADFTKNCKTQKAQAVGQLVGAPVMTAFISFVGICGTAGAAIVFKEAIWEPAVLVSKFDNPFIVIIFSLFIIMAVLTTNVAANLVPPTNVIATLFAKKVSYKKAALIAAVLALFAQPWNALASAYDLIYNVCGMLGALLGPISGLYLVSYLFEHKTEVDMVDMYKEDGGKYYYSKGFNVPIIIIFVAAMIIIFAGKYIAPLKFIFDNAYVVGSIGAGLAYFIYIKAAKRG